MADRSGLAKALARLWLDRSGNIALTAALSFPVMGGAALIAVEMSQLNAQHSALQTLADGGALAAARELRLGNAASDTIVGVARNFVAAGAAGLNLNYAFAAEVASDKTSIQITLRATGGAGLGAAIGLIEPEISVSATARVRGGAPVCAVALDATASSAIDLEKQARMEAKQCAVYSNSASSLGIRVKDTAKITAEFICSSGGKHGDPTGFSPSPDTDCPALPDPLAARPAPSVGTCDPMKSNLNISGLVIFLTPGTYCGGLKIDKGSIVTMQPGVYVFKDGSLEIAGGSTLTGVDVGLYFTGAGAGLNMKKDSTISLKAPHDGPMAGLLMFQDRLTAGDNEKFEISSDDAGMLLGTIYLPRGRLYLSGDKPIGHSSAYTIVIAGQINLTAGPTMVLNSDYSASTVPVPEGLGPLAKDIALEK